MGLLKKKAPPPPPPPPSAATRRAQRQYEHDVEAWRQQNMASVRQRREAERLLTQSQRARDCGDRAEAERLAREAYTTSDAAEQAYQAAEQRMQRSRPR